MTAETEFRIIALVASGQPQKAIAGELRLSPKTLGYHITKLYKRLHLTGIVELTHFAIHHRMVPVKQFTQPLPKIPNGMRVETCGYTKCGVTFLTAHSHQHHCCPAHQIAAKRLKVKTDGIKFYDRDCANEACRKHFRTNREQKIFCCRKCNHATQVRKWKAKRQPPIARGVKPRPMVHQEARPELAPAVA